MASAPAAAAPAEAAPKVAVPAPEKPADPAPPPGQSSEMAPAMPEKPVKEASVEVKPEIKAEIKPELKAEPKPEAKDEIAPQPGPTAETQSAVQPARNAAASERNAPPASAMRRWRCRKRALLAAAPAPEIIPGDPAVSVSAIRDSEGLHVTFSFDAMTPAALFRRADTVWLVFDTTKPIDLAPFKSNGGAVIADVKPLPLQKGQAIRIRLNRPQMPSLVGDGKANWTLTFADTMQTPTQPLAVSRNMTDPKLANVTVALSKSGRLHRLLDPDAGDTLLVVTATPPVRGFIKRQDFVEMSLLESIHGVAIRPNSDDVSVEVAPDKIIIGKPGGLTLSSANAASERAPTVPKAIFDVDDWHKNQQGNFNTSHDALIEAAAALEADQRTPVRMDLARFYLARGLYPEAKAVLDVVLADAKPGTEDPAALIMRSVANILMGRPGRGLKDLANPVVGNNYDSQLWKALALARQGKWADAREKFKNVEFAINSLPLDLQRIVITEAMRCAIEVKDYSGADKRSSDLDVIGLSPELKPTVSVMRGRLAEALGHEKDALAQYKIAVDSPDRQAAAEGKLYEIALKQKRDEISQPDALRELETLEVMWRRDALEVRALEMMSRIYSDTGHYSESLAAAKTATQLDPNSEMSRQGQEAAQASVRANISGIEGRRSSAGRCARNVLRIPRIDADRPPRRRNDPAIGGSAGRGRSARSGQRTAAISGRSPARGCGAGAGGGAAGDGLSDEPQAGSRHRGTSHHADRRPLG